MTETQLCPCGTGSSYERCCQPYHDGAKSAPTAEALLRSRYSAFAKGKIDYILETHHPRTRSEVKRDEIEQWSASSQWLGLEILNQAAGQETDDRGEIAFHAVYESEGKKHDHYEHALFEKEAGRWMFLDAQAIKQGTYRRADPKVGRNDPCPCGSGKKHKKCCAQVQPVA